MIKDKTSVKHDFLVIVAPSESILCKVRAGCFADKIKGPVDMAIFITYVFSYFLLDRFVWYLFTSWEILNLIYRWNKKKSENFGVGWFSPKTIDIQSKDINFDTFQMFVYFFELMCNSLFFWKQFLFPIIFPAW